jgi:hypothetical protein
MSGPEGRHGVAGRRAAAALGNVRARLITGFLWVSLCALWICARPYRGVRHDAILYLAQALDRLSPSIYSEDLFFRFGSQDRYSAFSFVMAPLVRVVGVTAAEVTLLGLAQLALLAGVARLLDQIGLRAWRWPVLLVLACAPHVYGGDGRLGFAEPFLTARTLAEPLAVWAAAWLLQRRWLPAAVAALAGLAMHPLIVLPVLVVGWINLCLRDRRWLWWLLGLAFIGALAFAGLAPFDGLLQRYDPEWWGIVSVHNAPVFVTRWGLADGQSIALDFALLGIAWRFAAEPEQARLWQSTLLAVAVLMVITILGADVGHDVLITQLQQWRVLWWAHLMVLTLSPWLVATLWRGERTHKVAALAVVLSLLAIGANLTTAWVFGVALALGLVAHRRRIQISTPMFRIVVVTFVLAGAAISAIVFAADLRALADDGDRLAGLASFRVLFAIPAVSLLIGGTVLWQQVRLPLAAAGLLALGMLAIAGTGWDQRSEWGTYIEADRSASRPFDAKVAPGSEVYWIDDVKATWFGLHARSFMSDDQAGGLLFNRATAIEYMRRAKAFAPLGAQREMCGIIGALGAGGGTPDSKCYPTLPVAQLLCDLPGGPRYLVFRSALERGVVAHWRFDAVRPAERADYYLHDCNLMHETPQ